MSQTSSQSNLVRSLSGLAAGVVICGVAVAVLMIGSYFAIGDRNEVSARAAGRLAGMALVPTIGLSFLAGFAWPSPERRRMALLFTFASFVPPIGLVTLLAIAPAPVALTDADRAAPVEQVRDGETWLVHAPLGLELPLPAGLTLVSDDELVAQTIERAGSLGSRIAMWRWVSPDETAQLVLTLDVEPTRTDQAEFMRGMVEGATEQFPPTLGPVEHDVRSPTDQVLRAAAPNGAGMAMRFFSYTHGDRAVFVSIAVVGANLLALEGIIDRARGHE